MGCFGNYLGADHRRLQFRIVYELGQTANSIADNEGKLNNKMSWTRLLRSILLVILVISIPRAIFAQQQSCQKVFLKVSIDSLSLLWNGDKGEKGRGWNGGEVYVTIWLYWPSSKVEKGANPQSVTIPLLGFLSGTVKEDPPNSKNYRIEPRKVLAPPQPILWEADCPVANYTVIDVLVWEDDSKRDSAKYIDLIGKAAGLAALKMPGAQLAGEVIGTLIDDLTKNRDTMLGKLSNAKITFPPPCLGPFGPIKKSFDLKNMVSDYLWGEARDEGTGKEFHEPPFNIAKPEFIGSMDFEVIGGHVVGGTSSEAINPPPPSPATPNCTCLQYLDFGQPDERVITGVLGLGGPLPLGPLTAEYSLFLDIDNNSATGAHGFPMDGAEYRMQLRFDNSTCSVATLSQYDPHSKTFKEIREGIYDAAINTDRRAIFLSVELANLGNPAGPIASWGVVKTKTGKADVLPVDRGMAPTISPSTQYNGIPPFVVSNTPLHDAVDVSRSTVIAVTFSKSMNRTKTEASFAITPQAAGSFSWQGDTLYFKPLSLLAPLTEYGIVIRATATDRCGTPLDGDGDMKPGGNFTWKFITKSLPLYSSDSAGVEKGRFIVGEPIYVSGTDFQPFKKTNICIVGHEGALTSGAKLVDMSDDGITQTMADGNGRILTLIGKILEEGEFNIVADLDLDGYFNPNIDRTDRTSIGFSVLPPQLRDIGTVFVGADPVGFMATGNIYDDSSLGFIYAHRNPPKVMFRKTDAVRVNQTTKAPTWSDYTHLVMVGGRAVNPTLAYYEDNGKATLKFSTNATHYLIMKGTTVAYAIVPLSVTSTNDYFIMEVLADGSHMVISLWGIAAPGTYAAGIHFDAQYTNLAALTAGWYVVRWQGAGTPLPSDTFTVVASGT